MDRSLALALSLLLCAPAAAEEGQEVTLAVDFTGAPAVRSITSWMVERDAKQDAAFSGVVRALWSPSGTDGIAVSGPTTVYALPRGDADAVAIDAVLAAAWTAAVVEAPAPDPVVAPPDPEPAPAPQGDEGAEPAPAEPAAEASAPLPEPVVVASPAPTGLAELVRLDDPEVLSGTLGAFAGTRWIVGTTVVQTVDDVEITRSVDAVGRCPDLGPGSRCVTLRTVALAGGAPAEGDLAVGQHRLVATWQVDAASMWIHAGRIERSVATGDAAAPVRAHGVVTVQLQPEAAPAPLP